MPFIAAKGYPVPRDKPWLEKMVATLRERAKTLAELVESAHYYLTEDISLDEKAASKFLTPEAAEPLKSLIARLSTLNDFDEAGIEREFTATLQERGIAMGKLAQPVRVALTGSTMSPGIHDVIAVLGKERTLKRLESALQYIQKLDSAQ
jgi:glutamyl-tRNA synthetase